MLTPEEFNAQLKAFELKKLVSEQEVAAFIETYELYYEDYEHDIQESQPEEALKSFEKIIPYIKTINALLDDGATLSYSKKARIQAYIEACTLGEYGQIDTQRIEAVTSRIEEIKSEHEDDIRAQQEAEKKALQEAERKAQQEAEQEAERKAQQETERKALEAERKAQQEAGKKVEEEACGTIIQEAEELKGDPHHILTARHMETLHATQPQTEKAFDTAFKAILMEQIETMHSEMHIAPTALEKTYKAIKQTHGKKGFDKTRGEYCSCVTALKEELREFHDKQVMKAKIQGAKLTSLVKEVRATLGGTDQRVSGLTLSAKDTKWIKTHREEILHAKQPAETYLKALKQYQGIRTVKSIIANLKKSGTGFFKDKTKIEKAQNIEEALKDVPIQDLGHIGDEEYAAQCVSEGRSGLRDLHLAVAQKRTSDKVPTIRTDGTIDPQTAATSTFPALLKAAKQIDSITYSDQEPTNIHRLN